MRALDRLLVAVLALSLLALAGALVITREAGPARAEAHAAMSTYEIVDFVRRVNHMLNERLQSHDREFKLAVGLVVEECAVVGTRVRC